MNARRKSSTTPLLQNEPESKARLSWFFQRCLCCNRGLTHREAILVVLPVFSGYAALFSLQRELKEAYNLRLFSDNATCGPNGTAFNSTGAVGQEFFQTYETGVSMLYIGNLIFRAGHNVFFTFLNPIRRVYLAMASMMLSMFILVFLTLGVPTAIFGCPSVFWTYLAYFLGGVAIGTFEANLLAVITPLGPTTKLWAIIGMPVGIVLITVGGFFIMNWETIVLKAAPFYVFVFVLLVMGMLVFRFSVPKEVSHHIPREDSPEPSFVDGETTTARDTTKSFKQEAIRAMSFKELIFDLKEFRQWLPRLIFHVPAMTINMFAVSLFSPGLLLYLYDQPTFDVDAFGHVYNIRYDLFFVVYNICFSLGDTLSRKVFYPSSRMCYCCCSKEKSMPILFPMFSLLFSGAGIGLGLSGFAFIVPLGGFFVAFGNGSLYAQTCGHIDKRINHSYNLISLSFWLFVGDIGSVIGTNVVPILRQHLSGS